jgi:cytochrome c biogenesis protein CcdA
MDCYSKAAMERAMKVQEVILRALARVNVKTSSVVGGGGVAFSPPCVLPLCPFDPSFL